MRVFVAFLVFFVLNNAVYGRPVKDFLSAKKDSNYIESYYKDLIVRIYTGEKTHSLELTDLANPYRLQYLPNGYFNLGVGVNYRSFGLSLATKIPFLLDNESKYGETKRLGIQSYVYTDKFTVDLITSRSKGFYLTNSFKHFASYTKEKEYQRPDITSSSIGLSINYIFNNTRFSYKAAFTDTDRQKRNAGSFLAGGSILSYRTKADSAFVPRGINETLFTKSRDVSQSGVLAFNANGGYAYSLIFLHNGIVTLSYMVGTGVQNDKFNRTSQENLNNWRFSFNQTGRFGIGYRYKRYYARVGIIRSTQYTNMKLNDLRIANGTDFVQISLGKRISLK
ncbi:MAG TPA: hypothetical protein DCL77_11410 [Prolixibacteraceae bacterium]|jgi:hypothetical protein|nr:hypothetical protein [Prolixibacteraceae bacterium]